MKRIVLNSVACLIWAAASLAAANVAQANEYESPPVYPDLFYNYYVQDPVYGIPAEMYTAPITTPPHTGYTYHTYPPLYPHEFLYRHHRTYYHYYNGGKGLNRTKVKWYGGRTFLPSYNPLF